MHNLKVSYFVDEMTETIDSFEKYKYDVSKKNISLYVFERDDLINLYILPEILDFNEINEEEFLKKYEDYITQIKYLDIYEFNLIINLLSKKYNLNLVDLDNNKNYSFLVSYIKQEEFEPVINLFIHYDKEKFKIK